MIVVDCISLNWLDRLYVPFKRLWRIHRNVLLVFVRDWWSWLRLDSLLHNLRSHLSILNPNLHILCLSIRIKPTITPFQRLTSAVISALTSSLRLNGVLLNYPISKGLVLKILLAVILSYLHGVKAIKIRQLSPMSEYLCLCDRFRYGLVKLSSLKLLPGVYCLSDPTGHL
jgi:hypothetical protein